jgi:hypothetical protein
MRSIFCFWTENVFPNQSNVFCPRMTKGGSLLLFSIGNILVDKNILCDNCFLIGLLVLFRIFK